MSAWLRLLPASLRRSVVGSRAHLDLDRLDGVRVRIAHAPYEKEAALGLVDRVYELRGWVPMPHLRFPSTVNVVAEHHGKIVGTVSVIRDSAARLPSDETYGAQIDWLRLTSGRLCEISGLTVLEEYRGLGLNFLLYRALFELVLYQ